MNKSTSPLLQVVALIATFAVLASLSLLIHFITPVSFEEKWKEVEITEGASFAKGIDILKNNGIIENSMTFLLLGRMTDTDRQLKPGYYSLSASMSPLQIFEDLISGRTIQFSINIPEGSTLKDIKKKFKDAGLIDEESWQLVYDTDFLASLDIYAPSLEGYIFPDTYNFSKGTDPKVIFKIMIQRLKEKFDEPLRERAEELGMSENEVLTLASIIEKEAIYDSERPMISAVYHNRLKKNMKLQADPTVLYGVKTRRKRIRYRDLRRETPYNTYVIKGLPPGPIASPGIKSIKAALYPADAEYMFFVSKNNGRHYFSRTGKEHMKAVVAFQRNGREFTRNAEKKEN
ncbi:MAG TPA: endolytic transglycosylase MltG [Nitrospirae bacterium]|nr:putative aminodeoxychorismate lyase [bacterium BMS3Abin06]HDH12533.1 endolytic transglycosylase MltG [Nitrospirota bacterium]HDZ00692.1 endolytic transglycosylase MltG [Nitrospirota bacterium]